MSAVMLLLFIPNDHYYYNMTCCIIQYAQSYNCKNIIFVIVSYMNHVSQ